MYKIPILILVYNRPDFLKRLIFVLKKIKPKKIYIKGDGPKQDSDNEKCRAVKKVIKNINWNCRVMTNFNKKNMGCRASVSDGINWFFTKEEMGVILEDDCLPNNSFFKYCEILLKKFYSNKNIFVISGSNFQEKVWGKNDYYFSKYNHCWGWAAWRRSWNYYDDKMSFWTEWKKTKSWKLFNKSLIERLYWEKIFNKVYRKKIDSWAYVWTACALKNKGLTITPNVNLIENIGFDKRATHTINLKKDYKYRGSKEIVWPLKHPKLVKVNKQADSYTFYNHFKGIYYLWPWRLFYIFSILVTDPKLFILKIIKLLKK
jgi:hypothetical protein